MREAIRRVVLVHHPKVLIPRMFGAGEIDFEEFLGFYNEIMADAGKAATSANDEIDDD